jgi:hypothetical protein
LKRSPARHLGAASVHPPNVLEFQLDSPIWRTQDVVVVVDVEVDVDERSRPTNGEPPSTTTSVHDHDHDHVHVHVEHPAGATQGSL